LTILSTFTFIYTHVTKCVVSVFNKEEDDDDDDNFQLFIT